MSDQGSIARHFSKGSEVYEQEASLQREIAHEVLRRIEVAGQPKRILDLGCGTGFLTSLLLQTFPNAQVDAIDISREMLRKARLFVTGSRVKWIAGDAINYEFDAPYDLIASSSAIQWIYPQDKLFEHIFGVMNPGGGFFFSLMLRGTFWELHGLRQQVAPNKPIRAELATAHDIAQYLKAAGLAVHEITEKVYRKEYSSAADFLWRIKEQGFTGGDISTAHQVLTRGELRALTQRYQAAYKSGHGVYATYCVGFFEARK